MPPPPFPSGIAMVCRGSLLRQRQNAQLAGQLSARVARPQRGAASQQLVSPERTLPRSGASTKINGYQAGVMWPVMAEGHQMPTGPMNWQEGPSQLPFGAPPGGHVPSLGHGQPQPVMQLSRNVAGMGLGSVNPRRVCQGLLWWLPCVTQ